MEQEVQLLGETPEERQQFEEPQVELLTTPEPTVQKDNDPAAAQMATVEVGTKGKEPQLAFKESQDQIANIGVRDSLALFEDGLQEASKQQFQFELDNALSIGDVEGAVAVVRDAGFPETVEDNFVAQISKIDEPNTEADASDLLYFNNKVLSFMEELQDKVGITDYLGDVGNDIISPRHDTALFNKVLVELGLIDKNALERRSLDANDVVDAVSAIRQMPQGRVDAMLERANEILASESGVFTANHLEMIKFWQFVLNTSQREANIMSAIGNIDLVTYPVGAVVGLGKMVGKGSVVQAARLLENDKIAATLGVKDIMDSTRATGFQRHELVQAALKTMNAQNTDAGRSLGGLSAEMQRTLKDFYSNRNIEELLASRGATLSPDEITEAVARVEADYANGTNKSIIEAVPVLQDDVKGVFNVLYGKADGTGYASKSTAVRAAKRKGLKKAAVEEKDGKFFIRNEETIDWTKKDVKALEQDVESMPLSMLNNFFKSGLASIDPKVIMTRAIGVRMEAKAANTFKKLYQEATKRVKGKDLKAVYSVIDEGDGFSKAGTAPGKIFSEDELAAKGLNFAQQESYYKIQDFRSLSHYMHDQSIVRNKRFQGFKQISVGGTKDKLQFVGKEVAAKDVGDLKIYNPVSKETVPPEKAAELMENGRYKLFRMDGQDKFGGKVYDAVISESQLAKGDRILSVLSYRPGEYSRFYKDSLFIVDKTSGKAVRTAPLEGQAKLFVEQQNKILQSVRAGRDKLVKSGVTDEKALIAKLTDDLAGKVDDTFDNLESTVNAVIKGEVDDSVEYGYKFDREFSPSDKSGKGVETLIDKEFEVLQAQGRALTGKRGEHLKDIYNKEARTMGVRESLMKESAMVARYSGFGSYKDALVEQFLKTFKEVGDPADSAVQRVLYGEFPSTMEPATKAYAERVRNHLATQLNIPTPSAVQQAERMRRISNYMEGKGFTNIAQTALEWRKGDPGGIMRSIVFNAYLGMFNLAQLTVQAQAGLMVLGMHPVHGTKAVMSYPVIRAGLLLDSVGNGAAIKELYKRSSGILGDNLGMNTIDDFMETIKLIKQTGALDDIYSSATFMGKEGVTNLEGVLAQYTGGIGSIARALPSDILALGRKPFNEGETFGRIMAVDVARRMLKEGHKNIDVLSREGSEWITAQAERLTFGMSRANIMGMQRGLTAIPFQFAHYQWKFAEALLSKNAKKTVTRTLTDGKVEMNIGTKKSPNWVPYDILELPYQGFTKQEKMGIGAMMLGAYGTASMPGLDLVAEQVFGENLSELTREQQIALKEGIPALLLSSIDKDSEISFGSRYAPLPYFDQLRKAIFVEGTPSEFLMGPAGGLIDNTWEGSKEIFELLREPELDTKSIGKSVVRTLAGLTSSTNTAYKYYVMVGLDQMVRSKTGKTLYEITPLEQIISIFGPKAYKEIESWDLRQKDIDLKDMRKGFIKRIDEAKREEMEATLNGDEEGKKSARQERATLYNTIVQMQGKPQADKVITAANMRGGQDPVWNTQYDRLVLKMGVGPQPESGDK